MRPELTVGRTNLLIGASGYGGRAGLFCPKLGVGPPGLNWSSIASVCGCNLCPVLRCSASVSSACSVSPERGRSSEGNRLKQSRWLTSAGLKEAFGHEYAYWHM